MSFPSCTLSCTIVSHALFTPKWSGTDPEKPERTGNTPLKYFLLCEVQYFVVTAKIGKFSTRGTFKIQFTPDLLLQMKREKIDMLTAKAK